MIAMATLGDGIHQQTKLKMGRFTEETQSILVRRRPQTKKKCAWGRYGMAAAQGDVYQSIRYLPGVPVIVNERTANGDGGMHVLLTTESRDNERTWGNRKKRHSPPTSRRSPNLDSSKNEQPEYDKHHGRRNDRFLNNIDATPYLMRRDTTKGTRPPQRDARLAPEI